MAALQTQLQTAMDEGDSASVTAAVRQISQLEARAAAVPVRTQPQQQPPQPTAEPEHADVAKIRDWSATRPWTQEGHKDRSWAAFQLNELYTTAEWQNTTVEQKTAEVERRYNEMASQPTTPAAAPVLDQRGSPRRRSGATSVKLSEAQKAVAVRMFDDKTRDEAYAEYAKGLE